MRTNIYSNIPRPQTHEGAPARRISPSKQLERSVASCFLWENEFYESGVDIAQRIFDLARDPAISAEYVADLAIRTRTHDNLRHVPLLLLSALVTRRPKAAFVGEAIAATIQRADELGEFVAIHAKVHGVTPDKVKPFISAQMKKGLAKAFRKFDEYQFAKYNRDSAAVKLRDVMFLAHPKPFTLQEQADKPLGDSRSRGTAELFKAIADDKLKTPYTWEVAYSAAKSDEEKREIWSDLLAKNALGYMALLRNLRNMTQVAVDERLIREAILARRGADRVLPFRFVAAARACPRFERELDEALVANVLDSPALMGKTAVLVDVSASMDQSLSSRSDLTRMDAAATLASILNCESLRAFTFSYALREVPPRLGMAGVDAIRNSQEHGGTYLGEALRALNERADYDRLIVVTDEQSHDSVPNPRPGSKGYMINVASNKYGVGYEPWVHINGFSEGVIKFIHAYEGLED